MIGFIQGKVLDTDGKKALILIESGVGYEINYSYFLEKNSTAQIFIHHHVSENDESLWGFNSLEDKKMFELLKTVNKVGSSKAYPLVASVGTEAVIQAIMFDQPHVLSQAPGIGKKMAEQIILSLKDKIENFRAAQLKTKNEITEENVTNGELPLQQDFDRNVFNDALMALDSLGYRDSEISKMVQNQLLKGVSTSEQVIKNVLREL